jgi:hypothetical protein
LPIPVHGAVEVIVGPGDGVVVDHAVLVESIDPPWQQLDLDMLRTVRLLV